jgi:hypothetical protein
MQVNLVKKYMPFDQSGVHLLINVSEGIERERSSEIKKFNPSGTRRGRCLLVD